MRQYLNQKNNIITSDDTWNTGNKKETLDTSKENFRSKQTLEGRNYTGFKSSRNMKQVPRVSGICTGSDNCVLKGDRPWTTFFYHPNCLKFGIIYENGKKNDILFLSLFPTTRRNRDAVKKTGKRRVTAKSILFVNFWRRELLLGSFERRKIALQIRERAFLIFHRIIF